MLHQLEPGKHTREVNAKHWRAVLHEYLPREYVFPIALAIFVAIVVWFGRSIHDFFIPSSSTVLIPSFVGQAVSDATAEATRFNLRSQVVARQMSDQYPKDVVMGQEPAPGSVVKPGREVSLVVSNGVTLYAMPDLRFQSMREAGLDLSHSHLQLNKVTYVRSDEVPANHIVSQDPPPLSTVREGSQVDLVVSKGGVSQIRVPSFVGETIDEVRDEMDRQGIHVGQIVWTPLGRSAPPHGTVVRQQPEAGAKIDPFDPVSLDVSAGPYESGYILRQVHVLASVPNDVGATSARVRLTVTDATGKWNLFDGYAQAGEKMNFTVTSLGTSVVDFFVNDALIGETRLGREPGAIYDQKRTPGPQATP